MLLEIGSKFDILGSDRILANLGQKEESDECTEYAQSAGYEERILTASDAVSASWRVSLDDGENVGANEGANLPRGGGNGVVLTADRCGTGLRSNKADIVAGPSFS